MTPPRRPLCPRCEARPVPAYKGKGRRPDYCGERACSEEFYRRKRQAAKEEMRTGAFQDALLEQGDRLRREMQQKIALVLGVENKFGPRLTEPLPRGGALVVLNGYERRELCKRLAQLDSAVAEAADILVRSRIRAHRAVARTLAAERPIVRLIGSDFLLSELHEPR